MKMKWFFALVVALNSPVFAFAGAACTPDAIREIGVDVQTFPGSAYLSDHAGTCYSAAGTARERALEKCRNADRERPFTNCRIASEPAECQSRYYEGWGWLYTFNTTVVGERMPLNLTQEVYTTRLCVRLNECLIDNLDDSAYQKKLERLAEKNGCFPNRR